MSEKKKTKMEIYVSSPPQESAALNEREAKLVAEIRAKNKGKPGDAATPDDTIIRFVRGYAREKDPVKETHSRYEKMLQWRKENNVDDMILTPVKNWKKYNEIYPAFIYGRDKIGRPVCYEQLGKLEPQQLLDFGIPGLEAGHIRHQEEMQKLKYHITRDELKGSLMYKHVAVVDLNGFGWKHMSTKFYGNIKKMMHIDGNYYPETLEKLIFINSSFMFRSLWAIVSPWVHPLTKARISLIGYDKKAILDALGEYIDIDQIPEYLGGQNKTPMTGICTRQFPDIDYTTNPATWKSDSTDPRATVLRNAKKSEEKKDTEKEIAEEAPKDPE